MSSALKSVPPELLTLDQLAKQWIDAKLAEQAANAARKATEELMLALVERKEEGTVNALAGMFKVKVTYKTTRSLDNDALQTHWNELNDFQRSAFRWKAEVDIKALRALQDMREDDYAALSPFLTIKPASPSFSVEAA